MNLEHVERERNYCSVAHELKVPFTAVDANCSKCSRARESRLVRFSKECKHEQHGRRVDAISGKSHATLPRMAYPDTQAEGSVTNSRDDVMRHV